MEELNATTIYWLISIGLMVGFITDLIMKGKGVSLTGNLAGGVIGTLIVGVFAILLDLFGALLFAAMGAFAFLFLINVFNIEAHAEDPGTAGK